MEKYTHVHVDGDAHTPERFWNYTFLTKKSVKTFKFKYGFVREITEKDRENLKHLMEKTHVRH